MNKSITTKKSKLVFGFDVGTNSVGWAAIKSNFENHQGEILGLGSRIIPMDQKEIGDFNKGILESAAAQRTKHRGVRRLRERQLKRKDRLVRVLKELGMIPHEWKANPRFSFAFERFEERTRFKFQDAYNEMRKEFSKVHPNLTSVTHDWVIYFLRKKALTCQISLEELAWVILQFNVKRGYYQLRGDADLDVSDGKYFVSDRVESVVDGEDGVRLIIQLGSGLVGEYRSKEVPDWIGKEVEFIVTEKMVKNELKVTLTKPDAEDWTLRKKKTETSITNSNLTVGAYIYSKLLADPQSKIRGKEVDTIDRRLYKEELLAILEHQATYHKELTDGKLLENAAKSLYKRNHAHRKNLVSRGTVHMIVEDIMYYQRPLKTKKHLIANCKYETYSYRDDNNEVRSKPVKGIAKSHPMYQEFRIWGQIHNIKVAAKSVVDDQGIIRPDQDVTVEVLDHKAKSALFAAFDRSKELTHSQILKTIGLNSKEYSINYEEGTKLKGNEFKAAIIKSAKAVAKTEVEKLLHNHEVLERIWHVIYSLGDNEDTLKAGLSNDQLDLSSEMRDALMGMPSFAKEYGAFSKKALSKLLPLMRVGEYWNQDDIHSKVLGRVEKIITGEVDESIGDAVREKLLGYRDVSDFAGCNLTVASYVAYDRHSEVLDTTRFESPDDIDLNINKMLPNHGLRNPTVEKIVRETILVARDMWKKFGRPDEIHVEMARELKLGGKKRGKYTYERNQNYLRNQRAKAMLLELSRDDSNVNPFSVGHLETFKIYEEGAVQNEKLLDKDIIAIRKKGDPTRSELTRYKLWLEQKYMSPYTGKVIPLSKLFTNQYEIEHIIPKALYYDDSFNNKIICERAANQFKGNRTAYEMICTSGGQALGGGVSLLTKDAYEGHIKTMFASINYKKYKKLLQYDPPKGFSSNQLNNTRYINRKLLEVLSPIVRQEGELGATSKNVLSMQGGVTSQLKNDWGLHDVWKRILAPRFQRMNELTDSNDYYNKVGNRIDLAGYENEIKRLDHRHHALDALVIACTTRNHVTYKNSLRGEEKRYDLRSKLMKNNDVNGRRHYVLPWKSIAQDAYDALSNTIVSFKNNVRVINKTINYYQKYIEQPDGSWKKGYVKQKTNHDHWAVRKPLHQEIIYGRGAKVEYKSVSIGAALNNVDLIANREIKKKLRKLLEVYKGNTTKVKKYLKEHPIELDGQEVTKIALRIINDKIATSQLRLDSKLEAKKLNKVVDVNLRQKLKDHLAEHNGKSDEAFSEVGLARFNKHRHNAVKSVKLMQDLGIAFPLGDGRDTKHKYGKGAKGTILYFVIYKNIETGEHIITKDSTMSFNDLLDIEKAGEEYAEQRENFLYFTLSPGDLVYVPEGTNLPLPQELDPSRIYKCVSFSDSACYFVPYYFAASIVEGKELDKGKNKTQKTFDGVMIKSRCVKLKIDRLGTVVQG